MNTNSARIANANLAPRCQHTKMNGHPCAAPARRGADYCVFHAGAHGKPDYTLRMIEDAMSLQYALFQVMRLLADKEVDTKRASLMLYALQIASSNLKRLHDETGELAHRGDEEDEKSLLQILLDRLQLPETVEEVMARMEVNAPNNALAPREKFDITACAEDAVTQLSRGPQLLQLLKSLRVKE